MFGKNYLFFTFSLIADKKKFKILSKYENEHCYTNPTPIYP